MTDGNIFKSRRFWTISGTIFIILLFVLSTCGYVDQQNTNIVSKSREYNGFKFNPGQSDGWAVVKDKSVYNFNYFPTELENITGDFNLNLNTNKVYFTYEPAEVDFSRSMAKLYTVLARDSIRPVKACLSEDSCPSELPIKDCAEEEFPVIFFEHSNITSISRQDKCIVLAADSVDEMDRIIERIYYQKLGIMG